MPEVRTRQDPRVEHPSAHSELIKRPVDVRLERLGYDGPFEISAAEVPPPPDGEGVEEGQLASFVMLEAESGLERLERGDAPVIEGYIGELVVVEHSDGEGAGRGQVRVNGRPVDQIDVLSLLTGGGLEGVRQIAAGCVSGEVSFARENCHRIRQASATPHSDLCDVAEGLYRHLQARPDRQNSDGCRRGYLDDVDIDQLTPPDGG